MRLGLCYCLNVYVPVHPHSYVEILLPNGMAVAVGCLGGVCHEGGALMNGILVLIEETT